MNLSRILVVSLALISLAASPVFSQEAVEGSPSPISAEPTPIESPTVANKKESSPEETPKPAKRKEGAKPTKTIEMMTPEEFKAAGLDKLSPEELKSLNDSLKGYRRNVETKATEKASAEATKRTAEAEKKAAEAEKRTAEVEKKAGRSLVRMDRIDSRVDGTLTRLTGHSIIRLEDGTMWKQANADDRFRAQVIDRPTASVEHGVFGYKMRISGLPDFYVDPVRK